jgi:hypothetical protein
LPFVGITPCRVADTRGNGFTEAQEKAIEQQKAEIEGLKARLTSLEARLLADSRP